MPAVSKRMSQEEMEQLAVHDPSELFSRAIAELFSKSPEVWWQYHSPIDGPHFLQGCQYGTVTLTHGPQIYESVGSIDFVKEDDFVTLTVPFNIRVDAVGNNPSSIDERAYMLLLGMAYSRQVLAESWKTTPEGIHKAVLEPSFLHPFETSVGYVVPNPDRFERMHPVTGAGTQETLEHHVLVSVRMSHHYVESTGTESGTSTVKQKIGTPDLARELSLVCRSVLTSKGVTGVCHGDPASLGDHMLNAYVQHYMVPRLLQPKPR